MSCGADQLVVSCSLVKMCERKVYVIAADWPYDRLTPIGRKTRNFGSVEYTHLGLLFEGVSPEEKDAIRRARAWRDDKYFRERIEDAECITWDYLVDKFPKFQSVTSNYYEGTTKRVLWSLDVDRAALLSAAIQITVAQPVNRDWYRYDALLHYRFYCCIGPSSLNPDPIDIPPSTCVALVLRAIAAARAGAGGADMSVAESDYATFAELGAPHGWCGWRYLTQLRPSDAIGVLHDAGILCEEVPWPQPCIPWGESTRLLRF